MATRDNLIATYQSNPTLQGRYTQQQYLDLFGFGTPATTTTTTPTTTTTTTTPAATTGIQNIIGQNLNQGGGGGGIQGLTLNTPSSARTAPINSAAFRDPLNEKIADQMRKQNPNLESRTNAEIIASNPDMFNIKTDRGFLQNTVDNISSGIGSAYKAFRESPIGIGMSFLNPASALASVAGMMGRKDLSDLDVAFNKSGDTYTSAGGIGGKDKYGINKESLFGNYAAFVGKESVDLEDAYAAAIDKLSKMGLTPAQIAKRTKDLKERRDYYQKQRERQEKQRMEAEAATAARARAANAAVYASADRQGFTNDQGGFSTSAADKAGTSEGSGQFSSRSGRGRQGYDDGGRVYLYNRLK